ncbi:potassium transporter [Loigolactobacillus backii]|uniref:cation:proton antiporter family protein n=1 Tax=Loigolactobacillus backii TaxID=375175 RepID=UPI0007F06EE5|nr:cation:proton antiporter family protein [Loigolactobacillus backii]ANK60220.1 potassium transporter [Loigolactobacillus backii]ANK65102.1 potassium transporter [Loigolactobacillus backii]ANK67661.1 potassium transporter [Loigolactobacillus backii]OLF69400.1 potassium transporter [Loigolactobacillus backii]PIO87112.1 potassium transporter [Loigolactobacillus backii]
MAQLSLLIVLLAALMTPLFMARFKITLVPTAVAEIIVGIILGKSFLNLVHFTANLRELSSLGVIILIFLSGMEIDFNLFRPQKPIGNAKPAKWTPVKLAVGAYTGIVITSALLGWLLHLTGLFNDILLATIIFSTIALGVVIAALTEKELLSKAFGQTILLTAALGEIVPLLALTAYASINGGQSKSLWLVLLIFLAAIFLLLRFRSIHQFFSRIDKSTTQLDIRLAFFLIFALVTIAERVGAENILGAFLAGIVMKLLQPSDATRDKLTSTGYGFFIPIFFITTGVKLDLPKLLSNRQSLVLIPVFFACFMLAKIIPVFFYRQRYTTKNAWAGGFLASTTITVVIPTSTVAQNLHAITSQQAGAFILAAVITCIFSPIIFNKLYAPEKEDLVKTRVTFIGTNLLTIPVAQQLSKGWYDIKMFTTIPKNYHTYNSEANVELLPDLDEQTLLDADAFNTDIMVLGYFDYNLNFRTAQTASKHNVPRIIARFEEKNVADNKDEILNQQGVELFNSFDVNISLLRGMIESPSTLKLLTDTSAGLYEVAVQNRRYAGMELQNLPFINSITISRIYRNGLFIAPHGDTFIEKGDHLIFTGDKADVPEIRHQLSIKN